MVPTLHCSAGLQLKRISSNPWWFRSEFQVLLVGKAMEKWTQKSWNPISRSLRDTDFEEICCFLAPFCYAESGQKVQWIRFSKMPLPHQEGRTGRSYLRVVEVTVDTKHNFARDLFWREQNRCMQIWGKGLEPIFYIYHTFSNLLPWPPNASIGRLKSGNFFSEEEPGCTFANDNNLGVPRCHQTPDTSTLC